MQSLMMFVIVVINVKKKIKYVKNAFFIFKIKKTFVNVIKTLPYFYRAMHFSAYARSWDRMCPSVCPSVCL